MDDKELFRRMMQDVTPLHQKIKSQKAKPQKFANISLPLSDFIRESVTPEETISWHHPQLTNFKPLLKKPFKILSKIDLHGEIVEAARQKLLNFIHHNYKRDIRQLLVIHGRGSPPAPKLKNMINCWLPQIPTILAFNSAKPYHGGAGATYVWLKKIK